jgi:hypothetical protein
MGLPPQTGLTFCLETKSQQKIQSRSFGIMMILLQSTVPVLPRNPSRCARGLLSKSIPQTVTLIVT